jgi:hypothetical protein
MKTILQITALYKNYTWLAKKKALNWDLPIQ